MLSAFHSPYGIIGQDPIIKLASLEFFVQLIGGRGTKCRGWLGARVR